MKIFLFLFLAIVTLVAFYFVASEIGKPSLKDVVENVMSGAKGKYGIVIKHSKTKEAYYAKEHELFEAGSLYKLWVMAEAFRKIKEGALKEDNLLAQDVATLNEKFGIDPNTGELREGRIAMTVSQALNQMITISHNYAALLLSEKLKNSSIAQFLKEQGFRESHLGDKINPPRTTPSDIALFYEKLQKGELIDKRFSLKMVELLKRQKSSGAIPKYLSNDLSVAHKTGDIGWFKHDGGIVFTQNGDYIIVVLSKSSYPLGAQERIAMLSEAVYKYFNK